MYWLNQLRILESLSRSNPLTNDTSSLIELEPDLLRADN